MSEDSPKKSKIVGEKYLRGDCCGSGSYGCVYKATLLANPNSVATFALKKHHYDSTEGFTDSVLREILSLSKLKHENILSLVDVFFDRTKERVWTVTPLLALDLMAYIKHVKEDNGEFQFDLIVSYLRQLLEGVAYMHGHGYIHCDLKPNNLLIDLEGNLKVADFGLTCVVNNNHTIKSCNGLVTLWYRSPEHLLGIRVFTQAIDVWSIGSILYQMITLEPAFPGQSETEMVYLIFNLLGTPNNEIWPGVTELPWWSERTPAFESKFRKTMKKKRVKKPLVEILQEFWIYKPEGRITAREALRRPWNKP
jgi:serine/threonine protein kinase